MPSLYRIPQERMLAGKKTWLLPIVLKRHINVQESGVNFQVRLQNGFRVQLNVFAVYDHPREVHTEDGRIEYEWPCITRRSCPREHCEVGFFLFRLPICLSGPLCVRLQASSSLVEASLSSQVKNLSRNLAQNEVAVQLIVRQEAKLNPLMKQAVT